VPVEHFRPLVPVFLTVVALYTFLHRDFGERHVPHAIAGVRWRLATDMIVVIGFYGRFFGPGTGSFFMFVRVFGYDFLNAPASARLLNVAANGAAIALFASRVELLWVYGFLMAACNVPARWSARDLRSSSAQPSCASCSLWSSRR